MFNRVSRYLILLSLAVTAVAQVGPSSPQTLPNAQIGVFYSNTSFPVGCPAQCGNYTLNYGILPPGLTLNPSTGVISGVPTSTGTYSFGPQATLLNAHNGVMLANYQITVLPGVPSGAPISPLAMLLTMAGLTAIGIFGSRRLRQQE